MELKALINKLTENLKDVKQHDADYCYITVEEIESIIEFLEQLKTIQENNLEI